MKSLFQDIRYSWRAMLKSPGFVLVAVLTLALGIGANAVVFSAINAFLLHPLNVPQADSLYAVWRANAGASESYPDYLDLRDRNRSFDDLVAYGVSAAGLDTGKDPSRVWLYEVSGNYFDALKIQPYLGRLLHASDEHGANSAPYIVLSYAFWHTHFQHDPGVVGRVVQVNKHPFTILGVAPPEFHGTLMFFNPELFLPLVNHEQVEGDNILNERGNHGAVFMAMGHVKAGVTQAQAIADLNAIGADLEKTYPKDDGKVSFSLVRPGLYGDYLGRPIREFLTGLMLLAGLILVAACANLGSLFAARAADRSREVALRLALGASRGRILRQLFTEATMISLIGGAVGLWGGVVLLRALSAWQPFPKWPVHVPVTPNATVYGVALLLTLASGFLFGAVPVRQILRTDPYELVKAGSTGKVGRRITVRDMLLVGQIAICAVLVTSSMVAVRGLVRSLHSDFGFEPQNAMLVETDLTMGGYRGDKVPAMQKRMIEALEAIPGVESVGLTDWTPLNADSKGALVFTDKTTDLTPGNAAAEPDIYNISPGYLRAAGTPLLSGRTFTWQDDKDAPPVAVVNHEFARKIFGSVTHALGGYYKIKDGTRIQVVGIAEDGKYESLTEDPQPALFRPILQSSATESWLVVRSNRDPQQLGPAIRSTLRGLDGALPLNINTWSKELDIPFFGPRIATKSLGVLGLMGAMLAVTGIFGMAAYSVSKRLRELGIRMALGAQRKEVLQAALGRPLKLLAIGSAAGLLLGILASRVLAFIVYQATPRDPLVLAGAVLAMSLLGLLATWIPAQRALSIDPLILLREE
jgi:predicted permease